MLRDALDERDHALGLGPGGALVSVVHDVMARALVPDVGRATLEVDADATGQVTAARAIDVSSDDAAWSEVMREVVTRMAPKRLVVRRGARGLRVRLRVVADRARPSGEKVTRSAGAVPDDAPGSDPVCQGTGAERRCTQGLPLGFSSNGEDVANWTNRASRVVRVTVVSETTL
jgi:hypothetical protein